MQAFKTANANLNKQKTQTTVSATTNQPSILPENKTHLRNERHDKDVDRECATCVVRLSGTLEDFQSGNPIVRIETETADAPGDISFKPDCHYPSTLCSGTLKGITSQKSNVQGYERAVDAICKQHTGAGRCFYIRSGRRTATQVVRRGIR
jgi:hypothetical protein